MLAAKHFDPVLGVDIHIVTIPPVGPVPIPHPHISLVMDPMDYVPVIGGTVLIGGIPRATAGTAGQPVPHIPMGGPFVKPPGNEDEVFMGSATVLADGAPMSFTALPVLSCQDVGMPAPVRAKKPKKSYGMLLPVSNVISIPAGMPVLVGGPPTIDMVGMAMAGGMAALGAAAKKLRGVMKKSKRIKKMSDAIQKKARKAMDKLGVPPNIQNKVHKGICTVTGHPVDVASGKMFTDHIDFELPGPIPLVWERTWYSCSTYKGPLGHGWHHKYDMKLVEQDRAVAVRLADGRSIAFPMLKRGESSVNDNEKITLYRDDKGYYCDDENNLRYFFVPCLGDLLNQPLKKIVDKSNGEKIELFYNDHAQLLSIIDSVGRQIKFSYSSDGFIDEIFLPHPDRNKDGESFSAIKYDYSDDDLAVVRNAVGSISGYKYKNHLMIQETDPNGLSFYFQYNNDTPAKCVKTWADGGIYARIIEYDNENNLTTVEDSLGHKTQYFHDGVIPYKVVDAAGAAVSCEFDQSYQLMSQTDELGRVTRYEYDNRGNVIKLENPDGSAMEMEYDENRKLTRAMDVLGGEWLWHYDSNGKLFEKKDPLGRSSRYLYSENKLCAIIDPAQGRTRIGYDIDGNIQVIEKPNAVKNYWRYDALGRLIQTRDANGNEQHLKYDLANRLQEVIEQDGNRRYFGYDLAGNILQVKDDQGVIEFRYEGLGRVVERSQSGVNVKFTYDSEEQLTSISNEKNIDCFFEYDAVGSLVKETDFDGLSRMYARNLAGHIEKVIKPSGKTAVYAYDDMCRVAQIKHSDGTFEKYEYRADGALMHAALNDVSIAFEKDSFGKVIREISGQHWVSSEFGTMDFRTRMQSSMGASQVIARNEVGEALSIMIGDNGIETRIKRDNLGFELERSLPGGLSSRWARDKLGRPIQHSVISNVQDMASTHFEWASNNRLLSVANGGSERILYEYDSSCNLVSAQHQNGTFDLRLPDCLGNLFKQYGELDREYSHSGRLLSSKSSDGTARYEYDDDGFLVRKMEGNKKIWNYEWNGCGMLVRVVKPNGEPIQYSYDALGRRVKKTVGKRSIHWLWDGNNLLHEWLSIDDTNYLEKKLPDTKVNHEQTAKASQSMGPIQAQGPPNDSNNTHEFPITWYFDPGSFCPMAKQVGDTYYSIVVDHTGAPSAMYDINGEKVWSASLNIWGGVETLYGAKGDCPFRWPGQYEDEDTGLYYNRFRYYDPSMGQYISRDPIGMVGGIRGYSYSPDPNTLYDPLGLILSNKEIGNIGEQAAAEFLEKNGHTVLGAVENRSGNGMDLITEAPGGQLRIWEVKANTSRLNHLQKKGPKDYAQLQTDRAMGRGPRKFTHKTPASQSLAQRLDKHLLGGGTINGAVIHVDVDRNTGGVSSVQMKRWKKCK